MCCRCERRVPWPATCVPPRRGFRVLLYGLRPAPAVCVLPPTPRSLIGTSGCQGGDPLLAMGRGACASGLDAGAQGRLYCVPSQEEEQQGRAGEQNASPWMLGDVRSAGWPRDSKWQHTGHNERPLDLHWSGATLRGCGGVFPQQRGLSTTLTDNPARAGGSPGAVLAFPKPALTGPATAALAGRSGTSPRLSPAGGVPVTPLGATRLRPYGSSGRAPARSVAGETPPLPEAAQGGAGATPRRRQGGRGERSGAGHATSAVPRIGATAAEVPRVPGVPGQAWPEAPERWQAAMQALEERPAPA